MAKKSSKSKNQKQEQTPAAEATKQSTFDYSPVPSSTRLMEVVNAIPQLPRSWQDLPQFGATLAQWHGQLRQAAHDACAAANDATGLMADIIDGRRKIDDDATRLIATVTAVRA